jgi:hypothetical protein
MGIGNSNTNVNPSISGSGSHKTIAIGDSAMKLKNGTAVQHVMNTVGATASKIIESGGDIITAPAVWLKDIQNNWLSYMVVTAIILSILAFFYRAFCFYLNRKKSDLSGNSLIELAKIINNKTGILQQPLPLSVLNLPSVPLNTPTEFRV